MQEKIPAEAKNNSYPSTQGLFEGFDRQFPRQLEEAKSRNDSVEIRKLEDWKKELDTILRSLEVGNTRPAQTKILSMIERNLEFVRLDFPNNVNEETHGERIRSLAEYLTELEAPAPRRATAEQTETPAESKMKRGATEKSELGTLSVEEINRSINELEMTEGQLRKSMAEIQSQKKRLGELLREAQLSKLRGDILT